MSHTRRTGPYVPYGTQTLASLKRPSTAAAPCQYTLHLFHTLVYFLEVAMMRWVRYSSGNYCAVDHGHQRCTVVPKVGKVGRYASPASAHDRPCLGIVVTDRRSTPQHGPTGGTAINGTPTSATGLSATSLQACGNPRNSRSVPKPNSATMARRLSHHSDGPGTGTQDLAGLHMHTNRQVWSAGSVMPIYISNKVNSRYSVHNRRVTVLGLAFHACRPLLGRPIAWLRLYHAGEPAIP